MTYIRVPQDRLGAIIGPQGEVKKLIEKLSSANIHIDSENGTVEVIVGDDPAKSIRAPEIIQAIARGFSPEKAMTLFDDELMMLEILDISNATNTPKELIRLKGRIIGKNGKTREIMESMIGVKISVYGKTVSILGKPEQIQIIRTAIEMLMSGATHGQVYSFLDKKKQALLQSQL